MLGWRSAIGQLAARIERRGVHPGHDGDEPREERTRRFLQRIIEAGRM